LEKKRKIPILQKSFENNTPFDSILDIFKMSIFSLVGPFVGEKTWSLHDGLVAFSVFSVPLHKNSENIFGKRLRHFFCFQIKCRKKAKKMPKRTNVGYAHSYAVNVVITIIICPPGSMRGNKMETWWKPILLKKMPFYLERRNLPRLLHP